jgi:hypothetical protein
MKGKQAIVGFLGVALLGAGVWCSLTRNRRDATAEMVGENPAAIGRAHFNAADRGARRLMVDGDGAGSETDLSLASSDVSAESGDVRAGLLRAASWARDFGASRLNIFHDEDEFVQGLIARDEHAANRIAALLAEAPHVDGDMRDIKHAPPDAVKVRLEAVSLLEAIARVEATEESAREAREGLMDMGTRELPRDLMPAAKSLMVGEKYDALVSLTRIDPQAAFDAFRKITQPERRKVLAPALMAGLVDRGLERSQVVAEFNRLLGP